MPIGDPIIACPVCYELYFYGSYHCCKSFSSTPFIPQVDLPDNTSQLNRIAKALETTNILLQKILEQYLKNGEVL